MNLMLLLWLIPIVLGVVIVIVTYRRDIDHAAERYVETYDFGDDFWDDWT